LIQNTSRTAGGPPAPQPTSASRSTLTPGGYRRRKANSYQWYFMSPPTAPLVSQGWPTFQQVLDKLSVLSNAHNIVFADDTILLYPKKIDSSVTDYLHHNGVNWLEIIHHHKKYIKRSKRLSPTKRLKNLFSRKRGQG
jgi:hypothetical protein